MSRTKAQPTRVISNKVSVRQRIRDIWRYHELLLGLVGKELKVKYKNSVLGFVWSMLNPALYLSVFYVVFQLLLKNGIPFFAIYLICGLLVWNLFSSALPAATGAVVGNAAIVKKVAFPREILPLACVGASLVHFCLQLVVLLGALAVFQYSPSYAFLPMLLPALLALLLFTSGLSILLSAINVYMRDTQHLLELLLLAWFWGTPIVYAYGLVVAHLQHSAWVYRLNPITPIVLTFQRAIYNNHPGGPPVPVGAWWYLSQLLVVMACSLLLIAGALKVFGRLEGNFAEEL